MKQSQNRPKRKAPRTAFKPGKSGNPGGRPKLTEHQRLARELKAQAQPEAIRVLKSIMVSNRAEQRDRISSAKALLEGLEPTHIDVTNRHESDTREKLDRLRRAFEGDPVSYEKALRALNDEATAEDQAEQH